MKKTLGLTLALAFTLSFAGTAFAATGPFADVPAKHWAYDAVSSLAKAGIIDGNGDRTFRGDRTVTRYEMAQIVGRAIEREDKADAQQKAVIDKLSVEFATELNNLGVRVAKIEQNQPKVKVSSETRYQLTVTDKVNGKTTSDNLLRQRIYFSGPVNEKITGNLRLQWIDKALEDKTENGFTADRIFFNVKDTLGLDWVLGRQTFLMGRGLFNNTSTENLDGIKVSAKLSPVVQLGGYYGREKWFDGSIVSDEREIAAADLSWQANEKVSVGGTYFTDRANETDYWTINGLKKINKDWTIVSEYGQNTNAANDPAAWFVQLTNGKAKTIFSGTIGTFADSNDPGSNAWALIYKSVDDNFLSNSNFKGGPLLGNDRKAFEVVYQNILMKNTVLTLSVSPDVKVKSSGASADKTGFARVEMFF